MAHRPTDQPDVAVGRAAEHAGPSNDTPLPDVPSGPEGLSVLMRTLVERARAQSEEIPAPNPHREDTIPYPIQLADDSIDLPPIDTPPAPIYRPIPTTSIAPSSTDSNATANVGSGTTPGSGPSMRGASMPRQTPTRPGMVPATSPAPPSAAAPASAAAAPSAAASSLSTALPGPSPWAQPTSPPPKTPHPFDTPSLPNFEGVLRAANGLKTQLPPTPAWSYPALNLLAGGHLVVKHENVQPTGAFKVRGALAFLAGLQSPAEMLVIASMGNHAQAMAYAARRYNIPLTVVMPESAPENKIDAVRMLGADVILHGTEASEATAHAKSLTTIYGWRYVDPGNELDVIHGHATLFLEMLCDYPNLDAVYVPIGSGAAAAGACLVREVVAPDTKIIGVQSVAAPAAYDSWRTKVLAKAPSDTRSSGLATREGFSIPQTVLRDRLDDFILVTEEAIDDAIHILADKAHTLVEGGAAASLAGYLADPRRPRSAGLVLTGGNADYRELSVVAGLAADDLAHSEVSPYVDTTTFSSYDDRGDYDDGYGDDDYHLDDLDEFGEPRWHDEYEALIRPSKDKPIEPDAASQWWDYDEPDDRGLKRRFGRSRSSRAAALPTEPITVADPPTVDARPSVRAPATRDPRDLREPRDPSDPRGGSDLRDGRDPRDSRDLRDVRDTRDLRDPRDARDARDPRDARELRTPRESRDIRDPRDTRDLRDLRDPRDSRDPRDTRELRERDLRDPRDSRDLRDLRDPRDSRDLRDPRDARDLRDPRERDLRDPRDSRDLRSSRDPRYPRDPRRDDRRR